NSTAEPFNIPAIAVPTLKQIANIAIVSNIEVAVIARRTVGRSNADKLSALCVGSISTLLGSRLIKNLALGPPIKPPKTKPNVAQAIAISVAVVKPYFSEKTAPQAAPVP